MAAQTIAGAINADAGTSGDSSPPLRQSVASGGDLSAELDNPSACPPAQSTSITPPVQINTLVSKPAHSQSPYHRHPSLHVPFGACNYPSMAGPGPTTPLRTRPKDHVLAQQATEASRKSYHYHQATNQATGYPYPNVPMYYPISVMIGTSQQSPTGSTPQFRYPCAPKNTTSALHFNEKATLDTSGPFLESLSTSSSQTSTNSAKITPLSHLIPMEITANTTSKTSLITAPEKPLVQSTAALKGLPSYSTIPAYSMYGYQPGIAFASSYSYTNALQFGQNQYAMYSTSNNNKTVQYHPPKKSAKTAAKLTKEPKAPKEPKALKEKKKAVDSILVDDANMIGTSLETTKRKYRRKPKDASKPLTKKSAVELMCVCRREYDPNRFCIQCDCCDNWYHGSCVHVKEEDAGGLEKWFCKHCDRNYKLKSVWKRRCFNENCIEFVDINSESSSPVTPLDTNAPTNLTNSNYQALGSSASQDKAVETSKEFTFRITSDILKNSASQDKAVETSKEFTFRITSDILKNAFRIIDLKEATHNIRLRKQRKFCTKECGLAVASEWVRQVIAEGWIFDMNETDSSSTAGMHVEKEPILPRYPEPGVIMLEQQEKSDLEELNVLRGKRERLKTRVINLKESGIRLEQLVYRSQDVNNRIKKYRDVLHPVTGVPLNNILCGYDVRFLEGIPLISPKDEDYLTATNLCLLQKKCPKHERWDTLKLNEIESELYLAMNDLDTAKHDIENCLSRIQKRRDEITLYHEKAMQRLKQKDLPKSFEGYYDISF